MHKQGRYQAGFTLIELVATIVILSIALVGVASMVGLGTSNSADTLLETRAIALGQSYLDEIMGRSFDERSARGGLTPCFGLATDPGPPARPCTATAALGPDGGEAPAGVPRRDLFDDVDDYHGLEEGDGATPIKDADGVTPREGYENFHVSITVRYAGTDAVLGTMPVPSVTHAKLITVSVRNRAQDVGWEFSAYKGNY